MENKVEIIEVSPRDGIQNEKRIGKTFAHISVVLMSSINE